MYNLKIINDYIDAVQVVGGASIAANGGSATIDNLGTLILDIPGMGPLNLIDIADRKLGYLKATWGVVIRYRGEDLIYRYEGQGGVKLAINNLGTVEMAFKGEWVKVDLEEITVEQPED